MKTKTSLLAIFIFTIFCSCKDDIILPTQLRIESQADLDLYCDKLMETKVYQGSISFDDDAGALDLSCFQNIREVTSFLYINSMDVASAFSNIEKVGGEGLAIGDTILESISFENLKECSALTFFHQTDLHEVHFPNIEYLDHLIFASSLKINKITGFHKVKTCVSINMHTPNAEINNLDIFQNLEGLTTMAIVLPAETILSSQSFNKLERIDATGHFDKDNLGYNVSQLFPGIDSCPDLSISNDESILDDFCYLSQSLISKNIDIVFYPSLEASIPNVTSYDSQDIIDNCQ
ncbi:MAG: hypothetical protein ACJA1A_000009 [Saprospiraceae bacterium]|jgi:hypothetical protein|tara:strand:- start:428 stop:1303 length:876 start_codon:yes stop_codon:yes gene_type:complete